MLVGVAVAVDVGVSVGRLVAVGVKVGGGGTSPQLLMPRYRAVMRFCPGKA